MALPTTPEEWLPVLAKRLDERVPRIMGLRGYGNGNAPLPEMGANLRASWEAFQRKARTNYGGLANRALCTRLRPNGLRIGDSDDHPALGAARRGWRDNRLDVQIAEAISDFVAVGVGYLVTGRDASGRAVVSRERPEQFYADTDPVRPWRARAAIKVWRDTVAGTDYAYVWVNGSGQLFSRQSRNKNNMLVRAASGGWVATGDADTYAGRPPVGILEREGGVAFIEPHLDVLDRINLGKLNRLVITAYQAFRQRAVRPRDGGSGLPDKDADGNDIDWAKALEPAPGALWDLPVPVDIWESQTTEITPLLAAEKADARDFAAVVGVPVAFLIPEGQNQSAEGAASAKELLIFQAKAEISRLSPALAVVIVDMLRAEGVDLDDATVEVLWTPPEHVSLSERFAAAVQAKGAGLSSKTIKRDILGMTPDQIRQDEADQASDALAAALLTIGAPQQEATGGADAASA